MLIYHQNEARRVVNMFNCEIKFNKHGGLAFKWTNQEREAVGEKERAKRPIILQRTARESQKRGCFYFRANLNHNMMHDTF